MEDNEGDESMWDASAIYEDVHSFTDVTQLYKEEIRQLKEENAEFVGENKKLTEQVKTLSDTSRSLNKNFSSIYRTARAEIQRLTFQNQELQKKYDELLIRRSSVTDRKLVNEALDRIRNLKPMCMHDFEVMEADFGKVIRVPDSNFTVISSNVSYSFSARQITPPPEFQKEDVVEDPASQPAEPGTSDLQYERPRNYDEIVIKDYEQTASLFIKSIKCRTQHGANRRENEKVEGDKHCGKVTIDNDVGPVIGEKDRPSRGATGSSVPEEVVKKSSLSGSRSRLRVDTEKSSRKENSTSEGSSSKPARSELEPSVRKETNAKKRTNTKSVPEKEVKQVKDTRYYENRHTRDHRLHCVPRVLDGNVDRPDQTPDSGVSVESATPSTRLSSSIDSEPEKRKKDRRSEESRKRKTEHKQDRTRDMEKLDQGSVIPSSEAAQLPSSSNDGSLLEREHRVEKGHVKAQEQKLLFNKDRDKYNPKYEKVMTKDSEHYNTQEKKSTTVAKTKDSRKDEKSLSLSSTRSKKPEESQNAKILTTEKTANVGSKDRKERSLKASITSVDMFKTMKHSEKDTKKREIFDKMEDAPCKSSSTRSSLKNYSESSIKEQKSIRSRSKEKSSTGSSVPSEAYQRYREKEKSRKEKEKASEQSTTNGEKKEPGSKENADTKKPRRKIGLGDYRKRYSFSSSDCTTPVSSFSPDDTLDNSRNKTFESRTEEYMEIDKSVNSTNNQDGTPDFKHEKTQEGAADVEHEQTREGTPNREHEPTRDANNDFDDSINAPASNTEELEALGGVADVTVHSEETEVLEKFQGDQLRRRSLERVERKQRGKQQPFSSTVQDEDWQPRSRDGRPRNGRQRSRSCSPSKRERRVPENSSRRAGQEYHRRISDSDLPGGSRSGDYRRTKYRSRSRSSSNESSSAKSYSDNRRGLKSKSGQTKYASRGKSPTLEGFARSSGESRRNRSDNSVSRHKVTGSENRLRTSPPSPPQKTKDDSPIPHQEEQKKDEKLFNEFEAENAKRYSKVECQQAIGSSSRSEHDIKSSNNTAESSSAARKTSLPTSDLGMSVAAHVHLEEGELSTASEDLEAQSPSPPKLPQSYKIPKKDFTQRSAPDANVITSQNPNDRLQVIDRELSPSSRKAARSSSSDRDKPKVEVSTHRRDRYHHEDEKSRNRQEHRLKRERSPSRDRERSPRRGQERSPRRGQERSPRKGQERSQRRERERSRSRDRERSRSRDRERSLERKRRRYRSPSNSRNMSRSLIRDRRTRSRSRQRSQTRPRADRRNSSSGESSRTPPKRRSESIGRSKLQASSSLHRKRSPSFSRDKARRRSRGDSRDRSAQTRDLRRYRSRSTSRERSRPSKGDLRSKIDRLKSSSNRRSSSESRDSPDRRSSPPSPRDQRRYENLRRSSTPQFSPESTLGPGIEAEVSEGLESEDVCRSPTPIDLY